MSGSIDSKVDSMDQTVASEEEMKLLDDPALYINRELSWLKVNERIGEELWDFIAKEVGYCKKVGVSYPMMNWNAYRKDWSLDWSVGKKL